jgi:hypothetical protein
MNGVVSLQRVVYSDLREEQSSSSLDVGHAVGIVDRNSYLTLVSSTGSFHTISMLLIRLLSSREVGMRLRSLMHETEVGISP